LISGFSNFSASSFTEENSSAAVFSFSLGYSPLTAVVAIPMADEAMPLIQPYAEEDTSLT
jgi:hypothetical protein